jgi:hypothetical protein
MTLRNALYGLALLLALLFIGTRDSLLHAQIQVTIGASKDNTLYQDTTGSLSDGAGQHFFTGRTNAGFRRRALVAFNLAGNIPQHAVILSARLTLNMSRTSSFGERVDLHRVLADWGEGTSVAAGDEGSGTGATTGDATWIHRFFNTQTWSTPGGDFDATPSETLHVSGVGTYTWGPTPVMVSDVQRWLDTASSNFGWLLIGNETSLQTTKRFDSKDNAVDSLRPRLVVTYQEVLGVKDPGIVGREYSLEQNYPNPFNPSTNIAYTLPKRSSVSLAVFNVLGMKVATIAEGVQEARPHSVVFDGSDLPSGVYYYRLLAGPFTSTRKLLLIR